MDSENECDNWVFCFQLFKGLPCSVPQKEVTGENLKSHLKTVLDSGGRQDFSAMEIWRDVGKR